MARKAMSPLENAYRYLQRTFKEHLRTMMPKLFIIWSLEDLSDEAELTFLQTEEVANSILAFYIDNPADGAFGTLSHVIDTVLKNLYNDEALGKLSGADAADYIVDKLMLNANNIYDELFDDICDDLFEESEDTTDEPI